MSFTDIFIRRPVLALVVSLLILLIGLKAMTALQIRQYPKLSNTTITVTTIYPGASPDLMQGFITTPISQAVATAEGIDYRRPLRSSARIEAAHEIVRTIVTKLTQDRPPSEDIDAMAAALRQGRFDEFME